MSRDLPIVNDQIYHIYNRGNEKKNIFIDQIDYKRALHTIDYYQYHETPFKYSRFKGLQSQEIESTYKQLKDQKSVLIEILAYCLMPNHYHFLIRQKSDKGVAQFIGQFQNSYTKYFNTKHNRTGRLFQGPYKASLIDTNEYLLHLSRYIHLNPTNSFLIKPEKLTSYVWSSLPEYLDESSKHLCQTSDVLDQFSSRDNYLNFIKEYIDNAQELNKIKHLIFDES